ncbi:MAG TPA: DUF2218 domain-containing protein [Bacteroidetes bacterium]|nr:DUF2218 domain-containing protein [Bacteroidota bacterium]
MITTEAHVATPTPARYVTRLCKHFAHKVDTLQNGPHGQIDFLDGTCTLDARADDLVLRVEADDAATVARLEDLVASHLIRFAEGRDALTVSWALVMPA